MIPVNILLGAEGRRHGGQLLATRCCSGAHYPQMETMLGKTRLKKLIVGSLAEMTSAPDAVTAAMKAAKQLSEIVWDDRHVGFA